LIKQILNNPILRVFSFNSIIVIGKVFSSFVVSKVSAIYLGPTGFAIVGNFKNVLQGILGITSSGFQSGVIRHIAENKNNKQQSSLIITSVFALSLFLSLLIAPFIYFFSDTLSISILNESSYAFIFKYLAICLPLISFNFLLLYIINGLQKIKLFTIISIVFNALNAVLIFLLIHFFNLKGALIVLFSANLGSKYNVNNEVKTSI
jgi:PST family polysaccharide transporter